MKIRIAQLLVTKDVQENLKKVSSVLHNSVEGEWVMFPEGMISGYYPEDSDYLSKLDMNSITDGLSNVAQLVKEKNITCLIGTTLQENQVWYNCSVFLSPDQKIMYRKNNLSTLDRVHFTAGNELKLYEKDSTKFGIQMCRELAFPEQWKVLKKSGAQVIFHINNAIKESDKIREQVLVARAFENQLWVCSVNNSASPQAMSSMIIDPSGKIIWQSTPQKEEVCAMELDLSLVTTQYLEQERTDLVDIIAK